MRASRIYRHRWVSLVRVAALAILALGLAGPPQSARAMVLEPLSLEEMTQLADSVVYVRTASTRADYETSPAAGGRSRIETSVRFEVLKTLKGKPRTEATILVPGGTVGGVTMALDSEPMFRAGETSILFLDSDGRVIGGPQGKVSVEKEMVPTLRMTAVDTMDRITQAVDDGSTWRTASKTLPAAAAAAGGSGTTVAPFLFQTQTSAASPAARFADGFESGMVGWEVFGDPTWGSSSYYRNSGSYSAYCAGSSIPAPGPYANDMNAWMIAGPFDLTDSTVAALEYDALLDTEAGFDWFFAGVSIDGVDFFGESGTGQSSGWVHRNLDLSALPDNSGGFLDYSAQPQVWVAFVFDSDDIGTDRGVWVDDVRLVAEQSPATPLPVITSIDPGRQSAGISGQVTVRGTGFGSTPGRVEFYNSPGGAKVSGPISSWSDTEIVCYVPSGRLTGFPGSASSGPVTVRNSSGQRSEGFPFSVTFAYSGSKLDAHASRDYRVNPNTPDTADEKRLVDAAVNAWGKESEFFLVDSGTCSAQTWVYNDENELFWTSDLPAGVVAASLTYGDGYSTDEFDIGFNDDYLWGDGTGGSYDVQSVAMHELGHAAGLLDLYGEADVGKVMYGFGSPGERVRALHPDDKAGVLSLYGPPQPVKITTAVIGGGSVQRSPDQTEFYRGESVTLTAVPGPGFTFHGWIGAASGSKNPVTVPITARTGVTAVFTGGFVPKPDLRTFTGPDRYATAVMISKTAHPTEAPVVFLVKGDNFPDALAAGPLAAAYGGPIMITPSEGLNQTVRQELARLRPSTVFVIGLPAALDDQVRATLPGVTIKTIRGRDRYHTATLLADELRAKLGTIPRVALVAGDNFPDALAVGPLAAKMGWAILLTPQMGPLPDVTARAIQDLGVEQALRVGTRVPLPASVRTVTDKVGTDRYHTSALVAEYGMTLGLSLEHIALVKGDNYPDALVVGPYMAQESGTLLLTAHTTLPAQIGALLVANRSAVATCDIVGLPADIQTPIRARLPAWTVVAAGQFNSYGVKADGSLWAWGDNGWRPDDFVPTRVGTATDWVSVDTHYNHRLAIKADGSLWSWGSNGNGQLGDGTIVPREVPVRVGTATDWLSVSAGDSHTVGVRRDGTLWAWGQNNSGQLGDGTLIDRHTPVRIGGAKDWVSVSGGFALKADGTLWLLGNEPKKVVGLRITNAVSVDSGGSHTFAIMEEGWLMGWGNNYYGQVGISSTWRRVDEPALVWLGSASGALSVSAGGDHSLAVGQDGSLWAWGNNSWGQIGDGTSTVPAKPIRIGFRKDWAAVVAGRNGTSLALRQDGTLWAWGRNESGELGDGTNISRNVPVQVLPR